MIHDKLQFRYNKKTIFNKFVKKNILSSNNYEILKVLCLMDNMLNDSSEIFKKR